MRILRIILTNAEAESTGYVIRGAAPLVAQADMVIAVNSDKGTARVHKVRSGSWNVEVSDQRIAEAKASEAVSVTEAQATTRFAGSGLCVNMYSVPVENATVVTGALDWFARNTPASWGEHPSKAQQIAQQWRRVRKALDELHRLTNDDDGDAVVPK